MTVRRGEDPPPTRDEARVGVRTLPRPEPTTPRSRRTLSARAKRGGRSTLRYMTRDVYRRCPYCREQIEGVFPTGPVPNTYADRDVEKLVSAHLGRHVDELEAELTRPGRR